MDKYVIRIIKRSIIITAILWPTTGLVNYGLSLPYWYCTHPSLGCRDAKESARTGLIFGPFGILPIMAENPFGTVYGFTYSCPCACPEPDSTARK